MLASLDVAEVARKRLCVRVCVRERERARARALAGYLAPPRALCRVADRGESRDGHPSRRVFHGQCKKNLKSQK